MHCLFKYILQNWPQELQPCSRSYRSRQNQTPIECSHHQHQVLWYFSPLLKGLLKASHGSQVEVILHIFKGIPALSETQCSTARRLEISLKTPWGRNRAQWFSLASLSIQHPPEWRMVSVQSHLPKSEAWFSFHFWKQFLLWNRCRPCWRTQR